ncbi:MAG: single-stranded DNA-binding protein [Cytophagales bacterium]|nr:MAG: single-stranded DNA-binding protein [Cytophagales bacterium]
MASYNKITIIGNLGADPTINTVGDKKVANFSLATNEKYKDKSGQEVERTTWFRVSFWGATAEIVEKYLKKGSQVFVEGRLGSREYTDSSGSVKTSLEVLGSALQLLGGRLADAGSGASAVSANSNTKKASQELEEDNFSANQDPDDLPF